MDSLSGVKLVKADGSSHAAEAALDGKDLVLYYFSAHWCPPCRQFTPMLKDFYEVQLLAPNWAQNNIILNSRQEAEGIEIVFVSSDRSAEDMASYMKVMTPQGGKSIKTTKQWMTMKVAKIKTQKTRIMMIKTAKKINSMQAWQQQNKRD